MYVHKYNWFNVFMGYVYVTANHNTNIRSTQKNHLLTYVHSYCILKFKIQFVHSNSLDMYVCN